MRERQQNSTNYPMSFFMASSSDHVTGVTGLTPTVTISKNGGAFAGASGSVTEIGNGWYSLAGNATDRNTLGQLLVHATGTGADPFDGVYTIVPWNPFDANLALTSLNGVAAAGTNGGLPTLDSNLTSKVNVTEWNNNTVATPNVNGVPIVDVVYVSGSGATSSSSVDANVTQWNGTSVGSTPPDAAFLAGTAQAGGANTMTLASGASSTDDLYNNRRITIVGGTGVGQSVIIASYVGTTKIATMDRNWTTQPDNTSKYILGSSANAVLSTTEQDSLINEMLDLVNTMESGESLRQTLRLIRSVLVGISSESSGTITFKRRDGSTTALTVVHDTTGSRTSSTVGTV